MRVCTCPHCGNPRIVTSKVPKDMVVVLPCPNCHELVVLFRSKVIGLNKRILENGTREERKAHIAEIITEFLDEGLFGFPSLGKRIEGTNDFEEEEGETLSGDVRLKASSPITEK